MVTLAGTVRDRTDGTVNVESTVSTLEHPELAVHVDDSGRFSFDVPRNAVLTVSLNAEDHPLTVQQPVALAGDVPNTGFSVIGGDEYDAIASLAPHSESSAILFVTVLTMDGCDVTGAHLGTVPESGTTVYAAPDQTPNPAYTEIQRDAPGGYIIGVTGSVRPIIYDLPAACTQLDFPVTASPLTFYGDVAAQPGAFHNVYLFVR